jgi:cyanobactin maturation PatA/PatG family protease
MDISLILPGLGLLWKCTKGRKDVRVAIVDGPVDTSHPCLRNAELLALRGIEGPSSAHSLDYTHGTQVTSVVFADHSSKISGISPLCTGLLLPVFTPGDDGRLSCSQHDLARAISLALASGADIINISGGIFIPQTRIDPQLEHIIQLSERRGVLVVAAAGNDGCCCLHLPASCDTVLAVGAANKHGKPIPGSNWGSGSNAQGIIALGEAIPVACKEDGYATGTGTSYSAPIVSGIAALLLSYSLELGRRISAKEIRNLLISTAQPCSAEEPTEGVRCLSGLLDIRAAYYAVASRGTNTDSLRRIMTNAPDSASDPLHFSSTAQTLVVEDKDNDTPENYSTLTSDRGQFAEDADKQTSSADDFSSAQASPPHQAPASRLEGCNLSRSLGTQQLLPSNSKLSMEQETSFRDTEGATKMAQLSSSDKECECNSGPLPFVSAIGAIGFDLVSVPRRDYFESQIRATGSSLENLLTDDPPLSADLTWLLKAGGTVPLYALTPGTSYTEETYNKLLEVRKLEQDADNGQRDIQITIIHGYLSGNVRLISGEIVPRIIPVHRGIFTYKISDVTEKAIASIEKERGQKIPENIKSLVQKGVASFVQRVLYDFRNLGIAPEDRALNAAITNVIGIVNFLIENNLDLPDDDKDKIPDFPLALQDIRVQSSPYCREGSQCYDVQAIFFNPKDVRAPRTYVRSTFDVGDVVPIAIGRLDQWQAP